MTAYLTTRKLHELVRLLCSIASDLTYNGLRILVTLGSKFIACKFADAQFCPGSGFDRNTRISRLSVVFPSMLEMNVSFMTRMWVVTCNKKEDVEHVAAQDLK